ncbi:hypothetical protein JQS43_21810 [Natronosporangium hydrolyticum]|uniref:Uncharacterized protein n=1 Tax=Natronosporangium hydrolyticum TaxID=2811111 RepID=A0A895Y8R4_9ACTN|nr:hypothetical protein [Natronosporangium hydrolyticum]QSB14134.1 hypothetical protein JQS43_21810 [Natronosporangium hydrolyticum]
MSDILHLQTRAYPLQHGAIEFTAGSVVVPGRGEVPLRAAELGSNAYNSEATIEAELTALVRGAVSLPGTEIVSCRARIMSSGVVFLTYALRHDVDLRSMDAYRLAEFDARVNRELRDADSEVIGEALYAAAAVGVLRDLVLRPGHDPEFGLTSVDRRAVRYNCHFVAVEPSWTPDPRVPVLSMGPCCQVLLPYTYAWAADPHSDLDDLLTMLEPADIATAQLSIVFSASIGGRRILDELARSQLGRLRADDLRRFLDRVWASYHRLDTYRLESAQQHRANYLATREVIGLDQAHRRAGELLDYVGKSLLAESSRRSQQLDSRLNRVAAGLTVVVAAAFAIDLAAWLLPDAGWHARLTVAIGVPVLSVAGLLAIVLSVRRRRRLQDEVARPGSSEPMPTHHVPAPVVGQRAGAPDPAGSDPAVAVSRIGLDSD